MNDHEVCDCLRCAAEEQLRSALAARGLEILAEEGRIDHPENVIPESVDYERADELLAEAFGFTTIPEEAALSMEAGVLTMDDIQALFEEVHEAVTPQPPTHDVVDSLATMGFTFPWDAATRRND
jgi:signal recognition particle GTPase